MPRNGLKREEFLKTLPALAAVPRLREARIKITDVRIVPLRTVKDLGSYPDWLGNPRPIRIGGGAIVEVHTDQGLTESAWTCPPRCSRQSKTCWWAPTHSMWTCMRSVCTDYKPGRVIAARAEIALWDRIGKASNQPLYKLWVAVETV